jgi:hypothetical protein
VASFDACLNSSGGLIVLDMIDTWDQSSRTWRQVAEQIIKETDQQKSSALIEELFGLLEDQTNTKRPLQKQVDAD